MTEYFLVAQILPGFYLLIKGADVLIDHACRLATKLGMNHFLVGLIFVSIGTSLPEFVVSIYSSWTHGASELIFANLMGSNLANICLVLGVFILFYPIDIAWNKIKRDWWVNLGILGLLFLLLVGPETIQQKPSLFLESWEGGILLLLFLIYLFSLIRYQGKGKHQELDINSRDASSKKRNVGLILLGSLMVGIGGKLVVDGTIFLATEVLEISQGVVGFTIIAIGTSLPELVTSLIAGKKNSKGIALGNILGSNIFNILWILGISAIIQPMKLPGLMLSDLMACGVSLIIFFLIIKVRGSRNSRSRGIPLLTFYFGYLLYIFFRG